MRKMRYLAWAILLCFILTACGSEGANPAVETPAVSSAEEESSAPLDSAESVPASEATPEEESPPLEKPSSKSDVLSVDESLTGEELLQSFTGQDFKQTSYRHVMEYVSDDGTSTQNITWVDAAGNRRTEMSMGEGQGAFIDIYLVDEDVSYQFQENSTYGTMYRYDDETSEYDDDEDDLKINLKDGFLDDDTVLIKAEIQNYKGQKALYVEMKISETDGNDYTVYTKYWMSLEYGILLEAETRMNESVAYIMRTVDFESGINPDPALFKVPDDVEFQDMSFDFLDGMADMDLDDMDFEGEDLDWLNDLLDDEDDD